MDLNQINALKEQLSSIDTKNTPLAQQWKIVSGTLLPILNEFMDTDGPETIAALATAAHGALNNIAPQQLFAVSLMAQFIGRDDIASKIKEMSAAPSQATALENAKLEKTIVSALPQKQHVALNKALTQIVPTQLKSFLENAVGNPKQSALEEVRAHRQNVKSKTVEELAQDAITKKKIFLPMLSQMLFLKSHKKHLPLA